MQEQTIELRSKSERDYFDLLGVINRQRAQHLKIHLNPTHVWLGPKQARILEVEMNWQNVEQRLPLTEVHLQALIYRKLSGVKVMGLEVVTRNLDGVSVGLNTLDKPRES